MRKCRKSLVKRMNGNRKGVTNKINGWNGKNLLSLFTLRFIQREMKNRKIIWNSGWYISIRFLRALSVNANAHLDRCVTLLQISDVSIFLLLLFSWFVCLSSTLFDVFIAQTIEREREHIVECSCCSSSTKSRQDLSKYLWTLNFDRNKIVTVIVKEL